MGLRGGGAERRDALAQPQQRRVARVRLLQPLSFRGRVLLPLAARQVHQAHLALAHRGAVAEVAVDLDGEAGAEPGARRWGLSVSSQRYLKVLLFNGVLFKEVFFRESVKLSFTGLLLKVFSY